MRRYLWRPVLRGRRQRPQGTIDKGNLHQSPRRSPAAPRRLFRQHRSKPDLPAASAEGVAECGTVQLLIELRMPPAPSPRTVLSGTASRDENVTTLGPPPTAAKSRRSSDTYFTPTLTRLLVPSKPAAVRCRSARGYLHRSGPGTQTRRATPAWPVASACIVASVRPPRFAPSTRPRRLLRSPSQGADAVPKE
jgi:hypothetical protein